MRRNLLLAATVLATLLSVPAHAEEGWSFGNSSCGNPVPCSSIKSGQLSNSDIISISNSCIANNLGHRGGNAFEDRGLDSNLCLTSKKSTKAADGGMVLMPKCCVVPVANNKEMCQIICKLIGTR